ncbi:MAG: hypothetical protein R3D26_24320 [Cyanobacteriota/Melainabacteria group bacterium]
MKPPSILKKTKQRASPPQNTASKASTLVESGPNGALSSAPAVMAQHVDCVMQRQRLRFSCREREAIAFTDSFDSGHPETLDRAASSSTID